MNADISRARVRRVVACWFVVIAWSVGVHARTIAVVRSPSAHPALEETVARIRGELLAVGLSVRLIERSAAHLGSRSASVSWFEQARAKSDLVAAIEVVGDAPPSADVWVIDEATQRPRVTRVTIAPDTENASEKLAIRAVEVLRSALLENDMQGDPRRDPASTASPSPQEATVPGEPPHADGDVPPIGLAAGISALTGVNGVGPAIMPTARVDFAPWQWLAVQAAVAGLGTRPLVESAAGSARLEQRYALLGARYRFRSGRNLRPFVALSVGALGTSVQGQAQPPRVEHSDDQWSLLVEGSLGADFRFLDHYYVSLASHVHFAEPSVAVRIVDSTVAVSGRPNVAITLTVGAWL